MKRVLTERRVNEKARLAEAGFAHAGTGWFEDRFYEFSRDEIIEIESATEVLHRDLMLVVDRIVRDPVILSRMGIPVPFQHIVKESWLRKDFDIAYRFDLARDTHGEIKLIEINGDTPTTLIETALIQWFWLVDKFPDLANAEEPGQFNSLHENLKLAWQRVANAIPKDDWIAFTANSLYAEEYATCEYHRDLASQCSVRTGFVDVNPARNQFMWNPTEKQFHEPGGHKINYWYKLYPWEWLMREQFSENYLQCEKNLAVIEPIWRSVMSNKAILSEFWKQFPGHKHLVPAWDQKDPSLGENYVRKPIWGREGTGIELVRKGEVERVQQATPDPVSANVPAVYQALIDVHQQDGYVTQFGSWIANGTPSGMIMRESPTRIISGSSPIIPHLYR